MPLNAEAVADHWCTFVRDFNTSALDFYKVIEGEVSARKVPDVRVERKTWSEGGILSANREYLCINRGQRTFAICAAPFGKDFFFSWWLLEPQPKFVLFAALAIFFGLPIIALTVIASAGILKGLVTIGFFSALVAAAIKGALQSGTPEWDATLRAVPLFGKLYALLFHTETFYSVDAAIMFRESISRIVDDTIRDVCGLEGERALAPVNASARQTASV